MSGKNINCRCKSLSLQFSVPKNSKMISKVQFQCARKRIINERLFHLKYFLFSEIRTVLNTLFKIVLFDTMLFLYSFFLCLKSIFAKKKAMITNSRIEMTHILGFAQQISINPLFWRNDTLGHIFLPPFSTCKQSN